MTTASRVCPRNPDTMVPARRIRMRTFLNWAASVCHADSRVVASSSFGPWIASLRCTSMSARPSRPLVRRLRAASTVRVCQESESSRDSTGAWARCGAAVIRATRPQSPSLSTSRPRAMTPSCFPCGAAAPRRGEPFRAQLLPTPGSAGRDRFPGPTAPRS